MSLLSVNCVHLTNSKNSPDKVLKLMVTTRSKVKPRSHHDVAHLQPLNNVPTKYQLPTLYSFQDIARTIFSNPKSLLQTYNPQPMTLTSINFLHLTASKKQPEQDFKTHEHYDKVKGQTKITPYVAHLQPLSNVPTKYQLPTLYGFQVIAWRRFYRSRSRQQGKRSNQGHTMTIHIYNPNQCPYQLATSYTLSF